MSRMRVVVTDHGFPDLDVEKQTLNRIHAHVEEFQCRTAQEVIHAVQDADAVLTQWALINSEVIDSMKVCKVIVRYGIGVDNIDLEAAGKKGIPVVNVPDYALDEVADHAITLLLTSAKKIPQVLKQIHQGIWETNPCRPIYSLSGKVLGLAGFGNIAKKVAVRAQAFGLKVTAYDPFVAEGEFKIHGVHRVDFDQLLSESDFISLHLPLTEETHHMFQSSAIQKMKKGIYLINTSRGGLIHTGDLIDALGNGHIAGAGLDVLEEEPIAIDSPLLDIPSVILTSHCAWYTEDALMRLKRFAADEIVRVFSGEAPKHIINRKWLRIN